MLPIVGPSTLKTTPLLCSVPAVTTMLPLVAPLGTTALMLALDQLLINPALPLKETLPANEVKLLPEIVMVAPGSPLLGAKPVTLGATVNPAPLLLSTPLVTTTLPVRALFGTTAAIVVFVQLETLAPCPLRVTIPGIEPKFVPEIVKGVPEAPLAGLRLLIAGAGTVNATPLLLTPEAVTTTLPLVAPIGTFVAIVDAEKLETVPDIPLNLTTGVVLPKFDPATVTGVPAAPEAGEVLVIIGAGTTVKLVPLLTLPPTVTVTFPVVAPTGTAVTI
jgi:hypothetical protein